MMAPPILWQNDDQTITLIDIPRSIEHAQGSIHDVRERHLLSSPPLQSPFPSNESKSKSARAKLEDCTNSAVFDESRCSVRFCDTVCISQRAERTKVRQSWDWRASLRQRRDQTHWKESSAANITRRSSGSDKGSNWARRMRPSSIPTTVAGSIASPSSTGNTSRTGSDLPPILSG